MHSLKAERRAQTVRALIVEDVENDAILLIDALEAAGFVLDWQRVDTESALLAALERQVDIVFSDFAMPQFNGTRALELLRHHDPDIPFIFVSGTIGEEAAVEAMKAGAQDYVMKGQLARLAPTVDRELRDVRLRRERRQADQMLRKLSLVVKQAADSVFITDPAGRIEYVNPAFENLTGYSAEEVMGKTPVILHSGGHDNQYYARLWKTIFRGGVFRGTMINRRKSGELFHEEKVITPLKDENGKITHFVSTGRDITERVEAEEAKRQLAAILEATPDMVAIFEPGGKMRYLNGAGRRLLGVSEKQNIESLALPDLLPESQALHLLRDVIALVEQEGSWSGEGSITTIEGQLPVSQVVLAHRNSDASIEYLSIIARDISERKRFEAELHHRATHDALTGLPNRFFLMDHFPYMLEQARRHEKFLAVMFLDLDNFKRINDSLGHAAGDTLLKQVAQRLRRALRPSDTIIRHGGDEFTIVAGDLVRVENTLVVLTKICSAFERPVMIDSHEVYVTFSTGIAVFPHDGESVDDLLRHADTAMYRAKSSGSSQYRFYAPDMNARGHEFLALEADLRRALENREFLLYYQPQVNLKSGKVVCLEALIRWLHPERGLVGPEEFIPLLENSGLIVPVGEWVLREACLMHARLREAGHDIPRVAINVSTAQFRDDELLGKVRDALVETGMPPHCLELEITENMVMQDPEAAAETLLALNQLGVRTAIDDFGTGYSSMAYLKRFPLNVLKIDQTFIADLGTDSGDEAIVEASISLARRLGLEVVAEGVETENQLEFLQQRGCDLVQGYYLSRPAPESEIGKIAVKCWSTLE